LTCDLDKTGTHDGKGEPAGKKHGPPVFGKMTIALIIGIFAVLIIFLAVFWPT
jgi:hypothetical protein